MGPYEQLAERMESCSGRGWADGWSVAVNPPRWRWGKSCSLWFLLVQNSKLKLDSLFPTRPDGDIPPL